MTFQADIHESIQRAASALRSQQRADGSWDTPSENDASFTAMFLLLTVFLNERNAEKEREMVKYLRATRNPDGGWVESELSYSTQRFEAGASNSMITGFVLQTLISANAQSTVGRGIEYLLSAQHADGLWHDTTWSGVWIPRHNYVRYHIAPAALVVSALCRVIVPTGKE